MRRWLGLAALASGGLMLVAFTTRVESTHFVPFSFGVAAGWLSTDDGREHPMKGAFSVNKFGFNGDVDTTEESIWDADDLPTEGDGPGRCFTNVGATPALMFVSSDDANDAEKEISIQVLDASWNRSTITLDLGVAAASSGTVYTLLSASTFLRVNRAFATDEAFAGNVYIHLDTADSDTNGVPDQPATQTVAVITAGENQTLQACFSVPLGFSALISQFCTGNLSQAAAPQDVTFRLRSSTDGGAPRTVELLTLADSVYQCTVHDPPMLEVEKTDLELTADAESASQGTSGTFDLLMIPNRT